MPNNGFAAVASGITRSALWSAEHLTAAAIEAARDLPRQGKFHPDARLPPGARAELEDYRGSGFDRGHMTPSGDAPDRRSQAQTFSLANMDDGKDTCCQFTQGWLRPVGACSWMIWARPRSLACLPQPARKPASMKRRYRWPGRP